MTDKVKSVETRAHANRSRTAIAALLLVVAVSTTSAQGTTVTPYKRPHSWERAQMLEHSETIKRGIGKKQPE